MPSKKAKSAKAAKTIKKATTKKAFDLSRDSVYTADPIADLRICGGSGILPEDQSGDLDTAPGPDLAVRDRKRLARPLKEGFLANIGRDGVRTPIIIAKIDDVPVVIDGKSRVRAARAENRRRVSLGQSPLIKVRCVMQRDVSQLAIMGAMISSNNARQDDDLTDQIEKLKIYLAAGASEADAAISFSVKQSTIRTWLDYDDHAVDELKELAKGGTVKASTAMELAKIKDPDEQRAAVGKLIATPGNQQQSARAARALRHGANGTPVALDRRSQKLLLAHVSELLGSEEIHEKYEVDDLVSEEEFWRGVRSALALVTGSGDAEKRLTDALALAKKKQEEGKEGAS
jgi:hypothetical protein